MSLCTSPLLLYIATPNCFDNTIKLYCIGKESRTRLMQETAGHERGSLQGISSSYYLLTRACISADTRDTCNGGKGEGKAMWGEVRTQIGT